MHQLLVAMIGLPAVLRVEDEVTRIDMDYSQTGSRHPGTFRLRFVGSRGDGGVSV